MYYWNKQLYNGLIFSKKDIKYFKKDIYIDGLPSDISEYYASKGSHYIQIENMGLYHDILKLGVPYFTCKVKLRIRSTKHIKNGIPTDITAALQFDRKTINKSHISIDNGLKIRDDFKHIMSKSPLRYPGGKTRAIKILDKYVSQYYPTRSILLSPFFGGGSFELFMKAKGLTIVGNDLFNPLYIFWKTLQTNKKRLVNDIKNKMPITKEDFLNFRSTICNSEDFEKASSYFVINRSSFSGATLCGGFSQQAADKRLTESSVKKLDNCNVDNITFTNLDCCLFLEQNPETDNTVVYADPPYYIKTYIYGKDGDMHEHFNHEAFSKCIQNRNDWIISYNDCDYIRNLYKGCRIFKESWSYGMNTSKKSSEIIILPPL